jgi:hypothetical protein
VIVAIPAATPVATPVVTPIVATVILLLLQVPPVTALLNVAVAPSHIEAEPVIAETAELTVTPAVTWQPVDNVYVIEATPPDTPLTTPPALIVATVVLLLPHVPPAVALLNVVVAPSQTTAAPAIVAGSAFTVTTLIAIQPAADV